MASYGAKPNPSPDASYRTVRQAIETKRPFSAIYDQRPRLLCPHRLGRNRQGELRVLCYQYGGSSSSGLKPLGSPDNWRCIALDKLRKIEILEGPWQSAPNHARPASCIAEADIDVEDFPLRAH